MPDNQQPNNYQQRFETVLALQFDQPALKRQKWYGLKVANSMWTYIGQGNNGFYETRRAQWELNRMWAKGTKDNKEFMNWMGVEGNKTWINVDYEILKIVPRWLKATVNRFMDRDEKPSVKATDILSTQFKERQKIISQALLHNRQRIQQMQQVSGMQLEPQLGQFEDEDQLDIYYKIEYRIPEESFMEDTTWQIWQNSGYEFLKRQGLGDCAKTNMIVLKLEELPFKPGSTMANRLRVRWCDPENTVHNIFKMQNGADVTIIGEAYAYSIAEARRKYPHVSEEEWFKVAQWCRKGLNQAKPITWLDSYIYSYTRPYDDYRFVAFDFEVKVYDKEYYVRPSDPNAGWGITPKKGRPVNTPPEVTIEEGGRENWYSGLWVVGSDVMLKWDVLPNQIRAFQNGVDSFSNYTVVYPDADGFYVPSLVERGIPIVRQMIGIALKIQQMVALMEPDNIAIDRGKLGNGVDLGQGNKLQPLQVMRLKKQTGQAWYDSTDESGVGIDDGSNPFQTLQYSGNVAQLNVLVSLFNFWEQRLHGEWGENAETLGMPTPGKKSAAATKQAASAGGGATEYVYDAWIEIAEQVSTKIVYKLWDYMVFEGMNYKEMSGIDRSMIDTTFDVNVDFVDKRGAKERLMMRVQEALDAKIITMSVAERLEQIDNPKTAILYLEKLEKRLKKEGQQQMMMQMQMNAQVQQQSTNIATEGKIRIEMAKAQAKAIIEQMKGDETAFKELLKMVNDAEKEAIKSSKELPPDIKILQQYLTSDVLMKRAQQGQQQMQPAQGQLMQQGTPQ